MSARKALVWVLALLYAPIYIVGILIVVISILMQCFGLLLTMDYRDAKREFQPIKRSFKKTFGI